MEVSGLDSPEPQKHMLTTDQVLNKGRYRIINSFSQDESGGMYEAYDTVSNTNVVLRECVGRSGKVATSNQLEAINTAFAGGAKALTEIRHDSLVSVQDYFSEIGRQYLVLESVTGSDLTKFLRADQARPTLTEVLGWADQLLGALSYLHTLAPAIIHHDITPENIKLTSGQKVKLLTAGIESDTSTGMAVPLSSQTSGNKAFPYRPIEQLWPGLDPTSQRVILHSYDERSAGLLMQPLDARSDLYSLGASLYQVLTSTSPCDALERSIAILDGKADPLPAPADVDQNIPPEISDVFMTAVAVRREHRFDSAVIMKQVLRTALVRFEERKAKEASAVRSPQPAAPIELRRADQPSESPEVQLERQRIETDERQREIEAEQQRLEAEQQRLELRRHELEAEKQRHLAEKKRLEAEAEAARARAEGERRRVERGRLEQEAENERLRVAQKLAELDTERSREFAEEERLEKEAADERSRAEERLQGLQAEQERRRSEQNRIEDEAKAELERAERRIRDLSGHGLDISEDGEDHALLELEPGQPVLVPADDELELLDTVSEPAINTAAVSHAAENHALSQREYDRTYDSVLTGMREPQKRSWRLPAIAVTVVVLMIAFAGAWFLMSSNSKDIKPTAAFEKQAVSTDRVVQPPASVEPDAQPAPAPVGAVATTPDETVRMSDEARKDPAAAVHDKTKKPAAVPAKTPPAKKKVTVDDLINDN